MVCPVEGREGDSRSHGQEPLSNPPPAPKPSLSLSLLSPSSSSSSSPPHLKRSNQKEVKQEEWCEPGIFGEKDQSFSGTGLNVIPQSIPESSSNFLPLAWPTPAPSAPPPQSPATTHILRRRPKMATELPIITNITIVIVINVITIIIKIIKIIPTPTDRKPPTFLGEDQRWPLSCPAVEPILCLALT